MHHPKSRHHDVLEDPDVARWHANLQANSWHTANVQRNHLGRFCKAVGLSPKDYLKLGAKKRADILQDYVSGETEKGLSGAYVNGYVTAVKSWLAHHGEQVGRKINIRGRHLKTRSKNDRIPSQEQLAETLRLAGPRVSVRAAVMASCGVRPEVLGFWKGTDGLTVGDIPDLTASKGVVQWERIPARVNVRPEISKAGNGYFTFLGPLACALIKADLEIRMHRGEAITKGTAIVVSTLKNGKRFISTPSVTKQIREAMRKAGLMEAPYVWRSYFSNRCLNSGMRFEFREFMMGHTQGISGLYSMGKVIPDDMVEKMRSEYDRACRYIEPGGAPGQADPLKEFASVLLQAAGLPPDKVHELELADRTQAEIVELLQSQVVKPMAENAKKPRQKLIPAEDLEQAQLAGYLYRDQLKDGRVIVELA